MVMLGDSYRCERCRVIDTPMDSDSLCCSCALDDARAALARSAAVVNAARALCEFHDDGLSVEGPDFWQAFSALCAALDAYNNQTKE